MDSDLSAEIARIEAELAQDAELRQQQQQQLAPQLQQQPPASLFGFGQTAPAQPQQQQQQQLFQTQPQQPQQQPSNPFNVNASPFMPTPQQPDYSQQQQQQQQQQQPIGGAGQAAASSFAPTPIVHSFSKDTDSRSIFIGNLPRGTDGTTTTPEELVQFFADCGNILNCTVLKDRATGELKGTAYIEFADYTAMGKAIDTKNNANFKGSTIIVCVSTSPLFYLQFSLPRLLKTHAAASCEEEGGARGRSVSVCGDGGVLRWRAVFG
ncbi:conserved hypothetical protein [Leishmania mexicana MHOM/GT/2001/U1103]|uniref:RRM domain-containing protein n=1 Tax=Leishmania mexicana (strain MHOM/GT/2001/U1103) TaxID=929439 RepID=E9AX24_LEIMU|nr:conserved hypothetical protein [Leishmania mexicana MHOM/GT/2001/U1103]CBZ27510.1 conserved hypothetical protein [Leishmania mexicana MHOM/GT/2001/U1103]